MNRTMLVLCMVSSTLVIPSCAQKPMGSPDLGLTTVAADESFDPLGGGGGGQAEYTAIKDNPFSLMAFGVTVSSLGIGAEAATNVGPSIDLRLFGNYTKLTHNFNQSGFNISLNLAMANTGAKVDFYPLHRFPLRFSPGYLVSNRNRVSARLNATPEATFTLNNVEYGSDPSNPVYGYGRLSLGGSGFMVTSGWGRVLSHARRKRFEFPFEAGVAFIKDPVAQFNLFGQVCSVTVQDDPNTSDCQPAAQFPTFATNLAAQVATWNHDVKPFHIFPIVQGGVSYSFSFRQGQRW